MILNHKNLSEAGMALAVLRKYQELHIDNPDKPAFAAALASLTAESMGCPLHTYSDDESTPFTLLVSEWTVSSFPSAVLIKMSIPDWTAAVSFWGFANQNLFRRNEGFDKLENVDRIIMKSTYELWTKTPKGSPVRWAEAARIYDESGLAAKEGSWCDGEDYENWNNSLNDLKPRLLKVLGYDSVLEIDPECLDEPFPTQFLQLVLVAESNALTPSLMPEYNPTYWVYACIAKPLPTHIPIEVLTNRGQLSPAQALAFYLVDEEYGPKLTYATAANMLGMNNRQEIGTHLKRARTILQTSGQDAKLSGFIRNEYINGEAPIAFEISCSSEAE